MKHLFRNHQIRLKLAAALVLSISAAAFSLPAQHIDISVGALNTTQNQPLRFNNGSTYGTNSQYARPLTFANSGAFAGHYFSSGVTFAAVGTGLGNAAAPGTQVRLRFVSVAGPAGGSFGVWDVPGFNPGEDESTALAFNVPVGTTNGTNSILLSENFGTAGADPYGHIHGRNFSATKPGLYVVGMQLYDAASNGSGGGPIHSPSALYSMYFQAGITIPAISRNTNNLTLIFATQNGKTYYLQATGTPSISNSWADITGPFAGNHHLRTVADTSANGAGYQFYRLRVTTP